MKEEMFYMTILVNEYIMNNDTSYYLDNYYSAIKDITNDYIKSDEYKKNESLLDSVMDYLKNNKRLVKYILNKNQVKDDEIL